MSGAQDHKEIAVKAASVAAAAGAGAAAVVADMNCDTKELVMIKLDPKRAALATQLAEAQTRAINAKIASVKAKYNETLTRLTETQSTFVQKHQEARQHRALMLTNSAALTTKEDNKRKSHAEAHRRFCHDAMQNNTRGARGHVIDGIQEDITQQVEKKCPYSSAFRCDPDREHPYYCVSIRTCDQSDDGGGPCAAFLSEQEFREWIVSALVLPPHDRVELFMEKDHILGCEYVSRLKIVLKPDMDLVETMQRTKQMNRQIGYYDGLVHDVEMAFSLEHVPVFDSLPALPRNLT
jgi:hypothetical protein